MKAIVSVSILLFTAIASASIWQTGYNLDGVLDFREVMPGALYRGGSGNTRTQMTSRQLGAVCEKGIGTLYYLYAKGFSGNKTHACSSNSTDYRMKDWDGAGLVEIHKAVHSSIKNQGRPVMIHCWYGIHATGMVAATALMQFCDVSAATAVKYWKVGIAPKLQYPKIIEKINNFKPNRSLDLTPAEKAQYCPAM